VATGRPTDGTHHRTPGIINKHPGEPREERFQHVGWGKTHGIYYTGFNMDNRETLHIMLNENGTIWHLLKDQTD
jgi:hypothetical protein